MTTKEQERKALEQIRKIVAGLGENSYIGTAFEGCFEIAEENIENDFGCSMKQRAESAEREATAQKKLADKFAAEYKALSEKKREMSAEMDKMLDKIDYLNATVRALETEKQEALDKAAWHEVQMQEAADWKRRAKEAEAELIDELKEVKITLKSGEEKVQRFAQVKFIDHEGFRFVLVVEESGWVTSYKIEEIATVTIE